MGKTGLGFRVYRTYQLSFFFFFGGGGGARVTGCLGVYHPGFQHPTSRFWVEDSSTCRLEFSAVVITGQLPA